MKKKWRMLMAVLCYLLGIVASIYVGGWLMLIEPIQCLMEAYETDSLNINLILINGAKVLLSTTIAGLVWCIGYIASNFFRGTEDEYDRKMEMERRKRKERIAGRKKQ